MTALPLRERLAKARLYVIVTRAFCHDEPLTTAREAVAGGADVIQMREKDLEDGEFYRQALSLAEVCRQGGALFIVNDRPHIALLAQADGVHSGQGDLPPHLTRRLVGDGRLIGRSTAAPEFALAALAEGSDYLGVGPVYATQTKAHRQAVGLDYVRWAANWNRLPFFAIGSVNRATLEAVLEAGARRVAVCTGISQARDIAAETAYYRSLIVARHPDCG
ncbi:MAG: thiamine phosphate synthase [Planctomycetota bacterium]|jgi:thiamine-phosphate pyrophosphorylase|nr:thiamine phosphate synthase [Planctomycetota bacterium]